MAYLLLIVVSLLSCAGQLCQKQAAQTHQSPRVLALWLASALLLMAMALLLWLLVLQQLPLSVAYPMLSFNFVLVTLAARYCFDEQTSATHWYGVALIILGILLMSLS